MAIPRLDVISIGTLSRNLLWNESHQTRTSHATCTLIRSGNRAILVDPGLPPQAIVARLYERSGLSADQIDTVFLTCLSPSHRHGAWAFENARLLCHEQEILATRQHLERILEELEADDPDGRRVRADLELISQCQHPPDKLADGVDLFPLPGPTVGGCGLLVSTPTTTTLVAGNAVPTLDHFLAQQVLPSCVDLDKAIESLREVYEIADLVVPGHDNIFVNPRSFGF